VFSFTATSYSEVCFVLFFGFLWHDCSLNSATPPALFCDGFCRDRVLPTIFWLQTTILLISASWVARTAGMSHWYPPMLVSQTSLQHGALSLQYSILIIGHSVKFTLIFPIMDGFSLYFFLRFLASYHLFRKNYFIESSKSIFMIYFLLKMEKKVLYFQCSLWYLNLPSFSPRLFILL
jgi:hypothetical protein